MFKNTLILCFSLIAICALGQQDSIPSSEVKATGSAEKKKTSASNPLLPAKGNFGVTFNLIGLTDTISIGSFKDFFGNDFLMMRYYVKDNAALRLGFGFNLINEKNSRVDSVGATQESRDSTFKRADYFLTPGFEKHFLTQNRLDPYLATAVMVGKVGRTKIRNVITVTDTTGKSTSDFTKDQEGGFLLGLQFIAGFNYFFSPRIAIGAEYGLGVQTSRSGGDWTEVTIDTPASGSPSVNREVGSESINSTRIKMNSNAGIMLSYFF